MLIIQRLRRRKRGLQQVTTSVDNIVAGRFCWEVLVRDDTRVRMYTLYTIKFQAQLTDAVQFE